MRELSLLLRFAVAVTATIARDYGEPRFATKNNGVVHVAHEKLHRRLHRHEQSTFIETTTTVVERAKQTTSEQVASVVPRFLAAWAPKYGSALPPLPSEELQALKTLYSSLGGPTWHIKVGWMSASNPCGSGDATNNSWYGVNCTTIEALAPSENASSHVTGLTLPQNNLVGMLLPLNSLQHLLQLDLSNSKSYETFGFSNSVSGTLVALCGLKKVSSVLLSGNYFTGTIPDCIQSLANITVLDLDYNAIQGSTPDEICHLRNLQELHLRGNSVQGSVPECIGEELTALRILDYSNLKADSSFGKQLLSGTLPATLCDLAHLDTLQFYATQALQGTLPGCFGAKQPQLQKLALNTNLFQGPIPEELCQASALVQLHLEDNALTGSIPSCLGSLSQLTELYLNYNQFQGPIPEGLCQLSAIQQLHLESNTLTGTLPSCLGNLSHLTGLDLDTNQFHGSIPEELCQLSALVHMYLEVNVLTGTIPSCLGNFSHLTDLSLDTNQFHGLVPEKLCQLSELVYLYLQGNALTGTLPSCLGGLNQLTGLYLDNNQIHGPIPEELCQLSALVQMYLTVNVLTGTIPSCLGSLSELTLLSLGTNQLNGPIPEELCQARAFNLLALYENELTGTIPSCLGDLSQLSKLSLGTNQFRGPIPVEICQAVALVNLYLDTNALTGNLPSCLGSLSHLYDILLYDNQFGGRIPEEVCQLRALEFLYLYENALSGTIPSCLGNISQLTGLNLRVNHFHGSIPEELCQASALRFLFLDSNALTGTIPSCLGSLSQLKWLFLDANQFHGQVPEELCQLSLLAGLSLEYNALAGTVSSCLGCLSNLVILGMSTNYFSGPIPEELCQANALNFVYLSKNLLTGTVPSCLADLGQLSEVELNYNKLHGTIPEALCQVSVLTLVWMNDNSFTGSIPNCLATSFPLLQSMLLQNNYLTGALPSSWALPSLVSIILSNNPELSGSLPPSLFLQQDASNVAESGSSNVVLRAVVIEGTSIGGSLPPALCAARHLGALAFSGNKLTGSLPSCIASMQSLQTVRVSNNQLSGTLPVAINNMTSLKVLDLSTNAIQGGVPAGLGDISLNLETLQLQLNRLSCDLPASVLDWQAASTNVSFNLLEGNLFGCGTSTFRGIFALSIRGAAGLRSANGQAFDAYNCGNSSYVLPVIAIAKVVLAVAIGLAVQYCRGRLALRWRFSFKWMVSPTTLTNELDHADNQLRDLALGVMAAAAVAGCLALLLSLHVAKSAYECEYMAASTLANKRYGDLRMLSVGIGAAGCAGLMLGLFPWWRRLMVKCPSGTQDYGSNIVRQLRYPFEEPAEEWNFDAVLKAESLPQMQAASSIEASIRVLNLLMLMMALLIFTVGPNIGYVLIVLSELPQEQKVLSGMIVTLAKTAIGTLLVPAVARKAVDILVPNSTLTFVRFRFRMVISTALSAMTMILFPVMSVLMTDQRCLYYVFKPQPAVDTVVPVPCCSVTSFSTGVCVEYATDTFTSTFKPSFAYDGEACVSAIISVYGPVFLGSVLFAAILPAAMEMIFVPLLAPWCYRNAESSTVACLSLNFLQAATLNVWPALSEAGVLLSSQLFPR